MKDKIARGFPPAGGSGGIDCAYASASCAADKTLPKNLGRGLSVDFYQKSKTVLLHGRQNAAQIFGPLSVVLKIGMAHSCAQYPASTSLAFSH